MLIGTPGPMELVIIAIIVLLLFGAKRVPEIGASIGKGIRDFKRSVSDVGRDVTELPTTPRASERLPEGETIRRPESEEARPEPKRLL